GKPGLDLVYYHAGRIWTYAMLGLLAGWLGSGLRHGSAALGWQQGLTILVALAVIAWGAAALGLIPGLRLDLSPPGSCFRTPSRPSWLTALLGEQRRSARLLLGALMGLLPCGLVYAALLVAATLPTPLHSALGMLLFGAGTLPALSALMLGSRLLPNWARLAGPRLSAAVLVAIGILMLARALMSPMHGHGMG
ncbi:MAG: sulfite exporter TauE/SafE family protein, partial [Acidobacteriota bacterium]